ncbi:hypothetical protein IHE26_06870 [Plesiomonas shigelloides]|uniref:hypothetical protein n=1 Tax=Plesiomonas shigelloides TaxID=703 RepID=UPI00177E217C|nr:hypothetical protein [Plesiomonas shigelloides]QOH80979.1 hypothetical protein IHE26_06870 [Plesiomonas shigelloides]
MDKTTLDLITSIATFSAVIVALIPSYRAHIEKTAKARNLRMRIAVKISIIIPSITYHSDPEHNEKPKVTFTIAEITDKYKEIETMLSEAQVLTPTEQDIISQAIANLEFMLPVLKAGSLHPESVNSIISILQKALDAMEKNGILYGKPHQPWLK